MQTRILCALITMAMAGSATAQAIQPLPTSAGLPPGPIITDLPPLPPGCAGRGAMPPPSARLPAASANQDGLIKAIGISSAQASIVQKVLERQDAQVQSLQRQRRNLDSQTCQDLRSILGNQGAARWSAAIPPPPPGGPGRGPGRGQDGRMPPPPPPPQDNRYASGRARWDGTQKGALFGRLFPLLE